MKRSSDGIIIFDGSEREIIEKDFEGIIVMLLPKKVTILVLENYFDSLNEKINHRFGVKMSIDKMSSEKNLRKQIWEKLDEISSFTAYGYPEIAMDEFTHEYIMRCIAKK